MPLPQALPLTAPYPPPLPPFQVAKAQLEGQRVIGEAVTSGLALNESMMWHPEWEVAARYVMSPPIRGAEHGKALRKVV